MSMLRPQPFLPFYNLELQARGRVPCFPSNHIQRKHKLRKVPHCLTSGTPFSPAEGEGKKSDPLKSEVSRIEIRTLKDCKLGIAMYPDFVYNADGGGGFGTIEKCKDGGKSAVVFDPAELYIPPLESKTTRFLGLPLPPLIRIQIVPRHFKGFIDNTGGKVATVV
jgi:hypothetical protein